MALPTLREHTLTFKWQYSSLTLPYRGKLLELGDPMILVIESDSQTRERLCKLVRWVDNRFSVEGINDQASAWPVITYRKPALVICGASMPGVASFVEKLRAALPNSVLLLHPEVNDEKLMSYVDGMLAEPLSRVAMLSYIGMMKRKRKNVPSARVMKSALARALPDIEHAGSSPSIKVEVTISSCDQLKFTMFPLQGTRLDAFLKQLGRQNVTGCSLRRNGGDITPELSTPLEDGDAVRVIVQEEWGGDGADKSAPASAPLLKTQMPTRPPPGQQ